MPSRHVPPSPAQASPVSDPATFTRRQGAWRTAEENWHWCVWSPWDESIRLVLWPHGERVERTMRPAQGGYFTHEEPASAEVTEGLRYAYRLPRHGFDLPDPASRWQPDGVHRPSALFDPASLRWTDSDWRGLELRELVIYELHIGTFTHGGTFDAVIERLPALVELGVTALEIMPIAQFPGGRNWGYDGVHPYAAQNTYGGPAGLARLVDAAHAAGLGVLLDCVYNHVGPEGNYLGLFGPYFTDRHHTPWGKAVNYDDAHSDPVRRYVVDNACQWIRDFHLDGLRLDAVQTIYDCSGYHILRELQDGVQQTAAECGRRALVIGETNQNDRRLVDRVECGGYGLDAIWTDDFHHAVHTLLTGQRDGYYADFGPTEHLIKLLKHVFAYDGCYSEFHRRRHGNRADDLPRERFVVCIQNHDQVGNRPAGDRLSKIIGPDAQRLAAALMLVSPFTPLLFMGEEYGETRPFPFFCSFEDASLTEAVRRGRKREFAELGWRGPTPDPPATATFAAAQLVWNWPAGSPQAGLRTLYRAMLDARRHWSGLQDREHTSAWLEADGRVLGIRRGQSPAAVEIRANLTDGPLEIIPPPGKHVVLSTAEVRFGGLRTTLDAITLLGPYELGLWIGHDRATLRA